MATIVSVQLPPQRLLSHCCCTSKSPPSASGLTLRSSKVQRQRHLLKPLRSVPSSTSVVDEGFLPPPSQILPLESDAEIDDPDALPLRGCKACGREEMERGCNGEGSIQGGIATFPGFGWWPIKAYRPCPGFVASGGRYKRRGQTMDQVASGGRKVPPSNETTSRKKGKDGRKFKR
ncbi:hypothetical protein Nepgr_031613 [Nepenthes gracilis]|uniref:Uncharacterized protein n=1 Tax=Nepenthes gracilis TaxID=150966 RepID=A0AAD3THP8_NEPGR|nr:hypothetical protein Nepgr_031613 [Nepenthes gracilis]